MNLALYGVTLFLLTLSYFKDKNKTKKSLKKALKSFENILPQFLGVIVLVGVLLAVFNPETISKVIGNQSGWIGVLVSGIIGSVTLIPFPQPLYCWKTEQAICRLQPLYPPS
ncbi:hypothetical protein [Ilyobacter polytropus]|uniref:hypothetical protein n=1 Tax=Ilyobacter polytropus TaxID=167642 RepID=UPI00030B9915|nr:hypothetical protein [Ilyobacter polytropus]